MKVIQVKLKEIKPYKRNTKTHPDEQIDKIANSIKEFGFNVPIILDSEYNIIAGHWRHLAAQRLGMTEIPVLIKDDLTPEQIQHLSEYLDEAVMIIARDFGVGQ